MSPQRIQRTEGWKPSKAQVWVGPRSNFYNPFAAKIKGGESGLATMTRQYLVDDFREWMTEPLHWGHPTGGPAWVSRKSWGSMLGVKYGDRFFITERLESLRGKDLVCRCHISQPCHADVLLEIANEVAL